MTETGKKTFPFMVRMIFFLKSFKDRYIIGIRYAQLYVAPHMPKIGSKLVYRVG